MHRTSKSPDLLGIIPCKPITMTFAYRPIQTKIVNEPG
jgi:hypothetical protein